MYIIKKQSVNQSSILSKSRTLSATLVVVQQIETTQKTIVNREKRVQMMTYKALVYKSSIAEWI